MSGRIQVLFVVSTFVFVGGPLVFILMSSGNPKGDRPVEIEPAPRPSGGGAISEETAGNAFTMAIDNAALARGEDCSDAAGVELAAWPIASGYRDESAGTIDRGGVVVWDVVLINNGRHYDPRTGIFRAPVAGIYELCATVEVGTSRGSARLQVGGAFVGPRRWYTLLGQTRYGRDCQVFTAKAGAPIALVTTHKHGSCEEAFCNFTTRLIAPACPPT